MSKYNLLACEIKNEKSMLAALQELAVEEADRRRLTGTARDTFIKGFFEVHPEGANLYGYQGDRRSEKGHYVIRRGNIEHWANDLGWQKLEDGSFRIILSDYDSGTDRPARRYADRINMLYGKHEIMRRAKLQGMNIEKVEEVNGKLKIRVGGYR